MPRRMARTNYTQGIANTLANFGLAKLLNSTPVIACFAKL